MGVYSTCQFLGIFFGGTLGGWIYGYFNINGVLLMCAFLGFLWWLITLLKNPGIPVEKQAEIPS